jgi:hypothetical protein
MKEALSLKKFKSTVTIEDVSFCSANGYQKNSRFFAGQILGCDLTQRTGRGQIKMTLNRCSDHVNFTPTAVPDLDARIPQRPDPNPI